MRWFFCAPSIQRGSRRGEFFIVFVSLVLFDFVPGVDESAVTCLSTCSDRSRQIRALISLWSLVLRVTDVVELFRIA